MPIYFDQKRGSWLYQFDRIINGNRVQANHRLPKGWRRDQAEEYDRKTSGEIYAEKSGLTLKRLTLAGAVVLYVENACPTLKSGKKIAQDLHRLTDYISNKWLDETEDVAGKYIKDQTGKLANATIHHRLSYLRAAVRYARKYHQYGKGQPDHASFMPMPQVDNQRQFYLTLAELNALWDAFDDPKARALFKLTFYLGLRWREELLTRKREHVIVNGDDVWLDIGRTKNGKPVMKYVHPDARASLDYIPFKEPVGRGSGRRVGRAGSDSYFYDRWHKAVALIGRPEVHIHDLRHSLASEILSRPNGTLEQVKSALHHVSIVSAQRYAHLYPTRQKEILADIGKSQIGNGVPVEPVPKDAVPVVTRPMLRVVK